MEPRILLGAVIILLAVLVGLFMVWFFLRSRGGVDVRTLMDSASDGGGGVGALRRELQGDKSGEVYERIKKETKRRGPVGKVKVTTEQKLFQAGMFTDRDRMEFARLRILCPLIAAPVLTALFWIPAGLDFGILGLGLGGLIGFQLPFSILDRRIARRHDEIMFFLPLVIEQISIGVSSSLDIGPCLQRVVQMADERDSHNVVTELVRYAQNYIRSGVPFEDAMVETGKASGHTELKHAFMYLSQVAKHGGEITRQLQELADSVSAQRQTHIEGKIKKLEVIATGPVSLVFVGFLVMLLVGFGVQLKKAF